MANLTTKERKRLPAKDFAIPSKAPKSGSYPVDTANRARNALARVSQFGSPAEKAKVRAKVHAKYPGIGKGVSHNKVGKHDGSSKAMARGGSALSTASRVASSATTKGSG